MPGLARRFYKKEKGRGAAKILFVFHLALIDAEKWISLVSVFNSDLWTPHAVIMNQWLYGYIYRNGLIPLVLSSQLVISINLIIIYIYMYIYQWTSLNKLFRLNS